MWRGAWHLNFIHDNFLLHSKTAQRLFHEYAEFEPILDYHSHLKPADIAENRRFRDLFEIWLEGDHYKWRAMRANGVAERFCTGDATAYEKFMAWSSTVPFTLRNPLYQWSHLELKRYFQFDGLLNESTAPAVWERANAALQEDDLTTQGILKKFGVRLLCTTDDPCDDLRDHRSMNASGLGFRMLPTFRPDKALLVHDPAAFNAWILQLEQASNIEVSSLQSFLDALKQRHDFFHTAGARLSDHGLERCFADACSKEQASSIFLNARDGKAATQQEREQFSSFLMLFLGRLDADRGWTKQLHLGALRATNTRRLRELGPDTGFDSIGDWEQIRPFCAYLDRLDQEHALPKVIVYNLNPADDYGFAAAIGNFQDGAIAGKIQFGSGWWFLDQKEGIEWQLNALSNVGLLSRFVGMVTDSRSFMSFPRHEYFRRVLCNLIGRDMENGELPSDEKLLGGMIRNICYENARKYLGFEIPPSDGQRKTA